MIVIGTEVRVRRGTLPRRELSGFLREAGTAIRLTGDVTALLTNDAEVRELNLRFRRKNKATDVLSFPSDSPGYAGDLAVSLDTAGRQAEENGHSLLLEVKILLLHGLLHLAGFDHEVDTGQMARRERALRGRFGLPPGLIQRTATKPAQAKSVPATAKRVTSRLTPSKRVSKRVTA